MKFKTLTSLTLASIMMLFSTPMALAANFTDLTADHWAYMQINDLTDRGIISGYPDNTFKPDNSVNRVEFTKMVLKVLDKDAMEITQKNVFTDLSLDFWAYDDILRSKELGLVVGYPDNTFKPYKNITKSEATSIIAKTIKKKNCEYLVPCPFTEQKNSVLKQFADYKQVANWSKKSFSKTVENELYVNYPNKNYLTPNKEMSRAETAVLLYKLRQNSSIITTKFQGPEIQEEILIKNQTQGAQKLNVEEYTTIIEHLPINQYTTNVNEVEIKGSIAKILAYNVVPVRFLSELNDKKFIEGQFVNFAFTDNYVTEEGTTIIPAGSKLVAEITQFNKRKLFNKNGKMELEIKHLAMPSGEIYPLNATIENSDVYNKKFGESNYKKIGVVSGSIAVVGSVLGVVIGALADDTGTGAVIGGSVAGGLAVITGFVMPGCAVKIPENQEIYVKFNNDVELDIK